MTRARRDLRSRGLRRRWRWLTVALVAVSVLAVGFGEQAEDVAAAAGIYRLSDDVPGAREPARDGTGTIVVSDTALRGGTGTRLVRRTVAPGPRSLADGTTGLQVVRALAHAGLGRVLGPGPPRILATGRHTALLQADAVGPPVDVALPRRGGGTNTLRSPRLRDLLVELDPATGGVRSAEPGPASSSSSWSAAATSLRPARASHGDGLVRLSQGGPAFAPYDGTPTLGADARDWPVSMVFTGGATVPKVKAALVRLGLTRRGGVRYLGFRTPGSTTVRFDADRGLKTACDAAGTDLHVRLYAPRPTDRILDPRWGQVVVATTHLDRADGCGSPPTAFGYSELAERRLGRLIADRLRWPVEPGLLELGNAEPLRRDATDPTHVWLSDGRATVVRVPR